MNTQIVERKQPAATRPVRHVGRFPSLHSGGTILLISDDRQLHDNLRSVANSLGQLVVRAEDPLGAGAVLQATRPVSVLLDLDLPKAAAWETADQLLQEPSCPPLLLLTGRTGQFDMQTALRAGVLISKNETPARLLAAIQEALKLSEINQAERNAIQRVLIRWLKPLAWSILNTPAQRFWGINE